METSDSECFESADEDFKSDDEDTICVKDEKIVKKCDDVKSLNENIEKLKDVRITDNKVEASLNNNQNVRTSTSENFVKDDENNVRTVEDNKNDAVVKQRSSKVDTEFGSLKKTNEINEETKKVDNTISKKGEELVSESLWDECEIDWGKEEEKTDNKEDKTVSQPVEENLWDDTEIDWGKEEKIEKNTVKKSESKKNDNLWDDSEVNWARKKNDSVWENDWEPVDKPQQKIQDTANNSWSSWGNWGVSSILSTATQSVSTLTQGITTVLESGIGVPDPEELARINRAENEKIGQVEGSENCDNSGFGLGNLVMGVSHLTKLVETTGTKVISGGLDTLETIGKKTMEVLQEGDPGLKKKRAFLKIDQDKPVLSQLLREAKEKAEKENKILEEKHFVKNAKNYETLFDDHQGLVHLEALEMLSKQCNIKLQNLLESYTDEALIEMQETMDQVKELCELPDEDEDEQANWEEIREKLNTAVEEINIPISYRKLIQTWEETETWLNNLKLEVCDARELHQQAVETLAQLTAIAVEQFHKAGELLLVKEHRSTADEADSLVQLTTTLTSLIGLVAAKFSEKLNAKSASLKNKGEANSLITNVFFEAANSSSYIQDAFQLLIPVLQVGAV